MAYIETLAVGAFVLTEFAAKTGIDIAGINKTGNPKIRVHSFHSWFKSKWPEKAHLTSHRIRKLYSLVFSCRLGGAVKINRMIIFFVCLHKYFFKSLLAAIAIEKIH